MRLCVKKNQFKPVQNFAKRFQFVQVFVIRKKYLDQNIGDKMSSPFLMKMKTVGYTS